MQRLNPTLWPLVAAAAAAALALVGCHSAIEAYEGPSLPTSEGIRANTVSLESQAEAGHTYSIGSKLSEHQLPWSYYIYDRNVGDVVATSEPALEDLGACCTLTNPSSTLPESQYCVDSNPRDYCHARGPNRLVLRSGQCTTRIPQCATGS